MQVYRRPINTSSSEAAALLEVPLQVEGNSSFLSIVQYSFYLMDAYGTCVVGGREGRGIHPRFTLDPRVDPLEPGQVPEIPHNVGGGLTQAFTEVLISTSAQNSPPTILKVTTVNTHSKTTRGSTSAYGTCVVARKGGGSSVGPP